MTMIDAAWGAAGALIARDLIGWYKAKRDSRVRTHSEGCWRWHNECAESLIEWQQAAIQRVRGIVDADQTVPIDARDPASYVAGYADATFRVRQVLDGGQR